MSLPDSDHDRASELLWRAAELLQTDAPVDAARLRGPLAELLENAAGGDDEGVVSPNAEAVALAILGQPASSRATR